MRDRGDPGPGTSLRSHVFPSYDPKLATRKRRISVAKVSVVLLAGTEQHSDLARALNALALVKEAKEAGDDVELVFDGGGVSWIPELNDPEHKLHGMFKGVQDRIAGACEFCAGAFGVKEQVRDAGVRFLSEFEGHPSLRKRVAEGYQVLTF